jgi:hypothetical protein
MQPATKAEIAKRRANLVALAKGRKATTAKDWRTAIAAFDEAVRADPHDARAYAERGYAHLLADDDLDAADKDFDRASELTVDKPLLAQIWFNRGLLDEKRDARDNALVDFRIANELAPSAAAKQKLAGKKVCPLRVESAPTPAVGKYVVEGPDWLGLSNDGATENDDVDARPKDLDEARTLLLGSNAEPALPAIATIGSAGHGRAVYVVGKRAKGGLRGVYIGGEWGGRCPGDVSFQLVAVRGSIVHLRGRELGESGYSYMCMPDDGSSHPCSETEYADESIPKQSFCSGGTPTERDVVVDLAAGRVVANVEQPSFERAEMKVTPKLVDGALAISGLDCDRIVPLDGGAP